MSLKDIKYVVGIDFGAISSGVSIAHTGKPSVKYTVNEWEEKKKDEKEKSKTKGPKQFLTSILYKADGTIICGLSNTANDKASRGKGDVYISNIKQYILNIDQANEELGQKKEGLTIQKIVTDYLKKLHGLAMKCLKSQEDFCESDKFKEDFKLENIRYCLSCPKSQKNFMEKCFVDAGIIESEDLSYRLVCVTEVEASAYYCLSLDRIKSKIVHDQEYFVCDIGHCSFGMSKIQADTTELLSKVDLISEEPGQGSMNLENYFRRYLNGLNLNQSIIDTTVETFIDEIKYTFSVTHVGVTEKEEEELRAQEKAEEEEAAKYDDDDYGDDDYGDDDYSDDENKSQEVTENSVENLGVAEGETAFVFSLLDLSGNTVEISEHDLNENVFEPYIKYVTDYILEKDSKNKGEAKIFLSGYYSSDAHFFDELTTVNNGKFEKYVSFVDDTNSVDIVSLGAVSFGLRFHDLQTPFFSPKKEKSSKEKLPEETKEEKKERKDKEEKEKEKEKERKEEEEKKEKEEEKKIDFVIGIDFGTTYSGCSYAKLKGLKDDEEVQIKTITDGWPGGDKFGFGKTPTLIMYDRRMKPKFWGEEAKQKVDANSDLNLLGNFKLFLSPKSIETYYGVNNAEIQKMAYQNNFKNSVKTEGGTRKKQDHNHDKVDAIDIISDYLRKFHDHVIKKIIGPEIKQNLLRGLFSRQKTKEDFNIRYVLTVPAMWSASAKETMAQASIEAGIIKKNELHKLRIITEPEAAALFCDKGYSKYIRDPAQPERESNFVVCDAGGGTVDLVTFGLKQHEKTGKPMIYQVGEGSGDTCGSSYLDSNFKEYILKFYEDMCVSVNLYNTDFNFVMDQFTKIKIKFNPDNDKDGYNDIKLPTERPIPYDRKTGKYMLRESRTEIRVMDTVMKEEIFDPIIDNIIRLINKQIKQAEDDSREIKSIILIGGFSRNPYLQNRIKNHYHNLYGICVPAEGVAAISHGAVSYGLNPRMVTTRLAGQSVALEVQAPFETKNENKYKEVLGPKGEKFVRNRLEYFVKKMDRIQGEIYHKTVSINYPQNVLIAIFSCDFKEGEEADDKNWRYVSNKHSKIMEEIIELPEVEGLEKGTNIEFDVSLKMDHIGVTVVIESVNNIIPGKANDNSRKLIMERKCNFVVFRNKKSLVQYSLTKSRFAYGSS